MVRQSIQTQPKFRVAATAVSLALAVLLVQVVAVFAFQEPATPSPADEEGVRAVPQKVEDAWARGDGAGVSEAFTEDVDFIAGDGRLVQGREALVPYFQGQFDEGGFLAGSRAVADVVNVRFLSGDVAVVHTLGGIMFPGETEVQPDWVGIQTWVVVKKNGEWLATSYHNSRVDPRLQEEMPVTESE